MLKKRPIQQGRMPKCHVRKGDSVMVIAGEGRGKTGTVVRVFPRLERVILDGEAALFHTKHVKRDPQKNVEGGRVQKPRPIHISNVALLDPTTGKACRVRHDRTGGRMVRVSKASGHRFEEA